MGGPRGETRFRGQLSAARTVAATPDFLAAAKLLQLPPVIIVRMRPDVRRDLLLLRQPDHVHRRPVAWRPAGSAPERAFQFPDRRIAGAADGVERKAGAGLAAFAHDLEPAVTAIEALRDRW